MYKQKIIGLFLLQLFVGSIIAMNNQSAFMAYKKNNFGDIFPLWEDVPKDQLTQKLCELVNALKDKEKGVPFIVQVPHENALVLDAVRKAKFELHFANNDRTEWIFKNGSSIPNPYTAIGGAQVLVKKNNMILAIEEKTRQGLLGFPAGIVAPQELSRLAASRELKEEVGLNVDPKKLSLIGLINRLRVNKYGASSYNHYYLINSEHVLGEIKPQSSEVIRTLWVSLEDIASKKTIDNLKISAPIAAIAQHILNGCKEVRSLTFPDYRQIDKKEHERDSQDTMTLELFGTGKDSFIEKQIEQARQKLQEDLEIVGHSSLEVMDVHHTFNVETHNIVVKAWQFLSEDEKLKYVDYYNYKSNPRYHFYQNY